MIWQIWQLLLYIVILSIPISYLASYFLLIPLLCLHLFLSISSIPIYSYLFLSIPIYSQLFLSIPIYSKLVLSIHIYSYLFLSIPSYVDGSSIPICYQSNYLFPTFPSHSYLYCQLFLSFPNWFISIHLVKIHYHVSFYIQSTWFKNSTLKMLVQGKAANGTKVEMLLLFYGT